MKFLSIALLLIFATAGCASTIAPPSDELFRSLGYNVILPVYDDLVEESSLLNDTIAELCAAPDVDLLAQAQEAWRRTRVPLKNSEAFRFGPIKTLGIDQAIDFWPTRPNSIEEAIADGLPLDDLSITNLGTSAKGMPAIEYLLFDPEGGNVAILALLTDAVSGARRCEYVSALARNVFLNAAALRDAWDSDGGFYLRRLIGAGDNQVYPTVSAATSDFVNSMIFLAESVQGMKIGGPLGKRSGGEADPESAESFFSGNSLNDIIANLEGLENLYFARYAGADGIGLDDYVRRQDPELADEIGRQIEAALESVRAIPPPLTEAVLNDPIIVENAYEEVRKVQVLLEGDFATVLGSTVTFSDNDGD
jgi:predicted lipoprotein